jgi:RNA polymerase sigma factor (sigma-70 family)
MVTGLVTEPHPILNDIVPSVVSLVHRRYRNYVDRSDLTQESYAWLMTRVSYFNELLEEENEGIRLANQRRIGWQMKRAIERYARKEKASKSGYQTNDESFYDATTIAQLLPYVIASVVNDTAIEQAQSLVNDGTPRKPAAPAEGGNLLATLLDIKKSYKLLDEDEQNILRLRYHKNYTLQQLSEALECAISTADRRCSNALRKMLNFMGGESPYQ